MAGTGAREVCDGQAAGPGAQGAGSVIVFPEGFKKRSDRVGFHVLKHRSWLLDGERCRSSDLFGGVCSSPREVEAVAAGDAEAEKMRALCVLEVELAGLAAALDAECMGERGTQADSSGKTVEREIRKFS